MNFAPGEPSGVPPDRPPAAPPRPWVRPAMRVAQSFARGDPLLPGRLSAALVDEYRGLRLDDASRLALPVGSGLPRVLLCAGLCLVAPAEGLPAATARSLSPPRRGPSRSSPATCRATSSCSSVAPGCVTPRACRWSASAPRWCTSRPWVCVRRCSCSPSCSRSGSTGLGLTALGLIAIPVLVVLLHPRVFGRLAARALRLLRRPPLGGRLGFATVLALLFYYVAAWMLAGAGAWLLGRGLDDRPRGRKRCPWSSSPTPSPTSWAWRRSSFPAGSACVRRCLQRLAGALASRWRGLAWALLLRFWVTAVELVFVGLTVGGRGDDAAKESCEVKPSTGIAGGGREGRGRRGRS